ncbi:MAG: NAD(P)/FAD-dependent oxidoreductase [Clostridiales bacterium]|nr:NAD(P)/FAD-dependent oxidoreductase [Clostridiales bacterium]
MKKVIVIGGGAAGMAAAAEAAVVGANVILLERNEKLGKKIYITGKGRCNVTNDCTQDEFLRSVVRNPRFCYSALAALSPQQLMQRIEQFGTPLKVERGSRVFPQSDKSSDIIRALERSVREAGAEIRLHTRVRGISVQEGAVCGVIADGETLPCDAVILAAGGLSYPSTGSTGDGLRMAAELGHTVTSLRPALTPFNAECVMLPQLQGLSLKNVALHARLGKKELFCEQGEMLFTHFGISGPLVLKLSSVLDAEELSALEVYVDLKPALDEAELDARLIRDFARFHQRQLKNALTELLPMRMQEPVLVLSGVSPEKPAGLLTRAERTALVRALKHFSIRLTGLRDYTEAVITRGGVSVKEINSSTMESKLIKGLYFAGEMIDIDAYTGGFNLQLAFSTGTLAGRAQAE